MAESSTLPPIYIAQQDNHPFFKANLIGRYRSAEQCSLCPLEASVLNQPIDREK